MDNETNLKQDEAFFQLEDYFNKVEIPYHKLKFKFIIGQDTGYNFIIPGAVIFVHSKNKFMHTDSVLKFERFLITLKEKDINTKIYVYVADIDKDTLNELIQSCGVNSYGLNIEYVADVKQIVPGDYIYYTDSCGPIYTFAVEEDISEYNFPIYVLKYQYDRACAFMTDSEIENVKRLDIKIVDKLPDNCYLVKLNRKNGNYRDNNYLDLFIKQIKFIPLPGGNRAPVRIVEGHSAPCKMCEGLFKAEYIVDDVCFKCRK